MHLLIPKSSYSDEFDLDTFKSLSVLTIILIFGYVSYLRDRYDIKTTTP
ncbi:hypothetical protein ACV3SM_09640 [Clostridium perfringens]